MNRQKKLKLLKRSYFSKPAWKYYYQFLKANQYKLIATSLGFIAVSYLVVPTMWLVKYVFDVAIPEKKVDTFIWVGLAILTLRIINSSLTLFLRKVNIEHVSSSIFELRKALLTNFFSFSRSFYSREDLGALHSRIVQDTERIAQMSNNIIAMLIPSVVTGFGLCAILIYLNWYLFVLILLYFPILYFSNKYMGRILQQKVFNYQLAFEGFSKGTLFLIQFMSLIKIQSMEQEEQEKHSLILKNLREKTTQRNYFNTINAQLQSVLLGLIGIIVLVVGGISYTKNIRLPSNCIYGNALICL